MAPGASPRGEFQPCCCFGLCLPRQGPAGLQGLSPCPHRPAAARLAWETGMKHGGLWTSGQAEVRRPLGGSQADVEPCPGPGSPRWRQRRMRLRAGPQGLGTPECPPPPQEAQAVSRKDRAGAKGGCDPGAVVARGGAGGLDGAGPVRWPLLRLHLGTAESPPPLGAGAQRSSVASTSTLGRPRHGKRSRVVPEPHLLARRLGVLDGRIPAPGPRR